MRAGIAAACAAGFAFACGGGAAGSDADGLRSCEEYKDVPEEPLRRIDLLFVIDESASMADEQANLQENLHWFVNVLENVEGGLPDVHIAVVSSDLARGGRFVGGDFLIDVENRDGTRTRNYDGALEDAFAARALLGAGGGEPSQPLEAMRRALDGSNPENAGFVRDMAYLFVLILTDADDCSAADGGAFAVGDPFACTGYGVSCDGAPVAPLPGTYGSCAPQDGSPYVLHPDVYVEFLRSLKEDPSLLVLSLVAGPAQPFEVVAGPELAPSCSTATGETAPAVRLDWILEQFPNRNTTTPICSSDLADAMIQLAELLARTLGSPCLQGALDTTDLRPDLPGLQIECQVSEVRYLSTPLEAETPMARCELAGDARPCWRVEEHPVECPDTPSHLILHVERDDLAAIGTHVIARCACR